jgi:hypothetical protein
VKPATLCLTLALVAVPVAARAQVQVGTRVGMPVTPIGYDDGGRRDPFLSLVRPATTAPTEPGGKPKGDTLRSVAVSEVKVTGVLKGPNGRYHSAIVVGPNQLSYLVKPQDRLFDGWVKTIDALGVVIVARTTDVSGAVEGREVRKLLHPEAEVIR